MTSTKANVSVVIPAFNAETTIVRAIESVVAQTMKPREILVVDDGSRVPVESVVPKTNGLRILRQGNRGAAAARNLGIKEARGAFIAFLDSDDEWLPNRLESQQRALERYPELGFMWGAFFRRNVAESEIELMVPEEMTDRALVLSPSEAFHLAYRVQTSTVLARRDLLLASPFDTSLRTAEDRDVWIRLLLRTKSFCVGEALAIHYESAGSLSNSDFDDDARNMLAVISRYRGLLGPAETKRREADVYRRWAGVLVAAGHSSSALAPAWQYLRRAPASPNAWYVAGRTLAAIAQDRGSGMARPRGSGR